MNLYLLGHMGLGLLSVYMLNKISKVNYSVPLVCLCSILPDIDIFIPFLPHRGPTHSVILPLILLPMVLIRFRKGLPYLVSFLSHSLIGDLITSYGGSSKGMYLWPLSNSWVDLGITWDMQSTSESFFEYALFGLMIFLIIYHNYQENWAQSLLIIVYASFNNTTKITKSAHTITCARV